MKTNARLLKQSSDKDDMNAKSLSTILHLKQHNEELEKENDVLKQKVLAAQQLSLAARLASNAKDRVGEEALKEKEVRIIRICHSMIIYPNFYFDLTLMFLSTHSITASRRDSETIERGMSINT